MALALERARPSPAVVTAALAVGLALVYLPVLRNLLGVWSQVSYYSYAFLIPVFSAYLCWDTRRRLAGPLVAWVPGLGAVAAGLAVLEIGATAASVTVEALSIPLVIGGVALFAVGPRRYRAIAFPIAFLALMAPLPHGTIPALSLPLQHLAATFTAQALPLLGIPAAQDGLFVYLEGLRLHVTEACNGLRFLLAMVVVGAAFAWLTQTGIARRLAVFAIAIGVAIASNLVRVAGTGVLAHAWGPDAAEGFYHMAYGKVVYGVMLVPFVAAVLWLRRSRPPSP